MARPLRVVRAGGWQHVFARGLNRVPLFADDRDRQHLLELLAEMTLRYGLRSGAQTGLRFATGMGTGGPPW
jgi:hypothetical protein